MRSPFACLASCVLALAPLAASPSLPLPVMSDPVPLSGWRGFSLPKAFQSNPELDMTVIDELTDYGRSLPPASPDHPVYYVGHNAGYAERGVNCGDHPPDANYLGRLLQRALSTNGFLPATTAHPPTLALFFHWGSYNRLDPEMRQMFPVLARRQMLERSILVGGRRFETSIARRMEWGSNAADLEYRVELLTDQASDSLYFVVVSAYDFAALQRRERRLAWRASLTVNALGVSMTDSLPALILTAAPAFGRDMSAPDIVRRRVRRGVVNLGEPTVLEADVPLPAPRKSN